MKTPLSIVAWIAWGLILLGGCHAPVAAVRAAPIGAKPSVALATSVHSEDDATIPITSDDAVRGNRLAPVTVVVFSDFECPFCAQLEGTFSALRERYGEEQLRFVFKNNPLPFHSSARLAAEVGQGVLSLGGDEAFWRFEAMAFHRQEMISADALRAWAIAAGVDGNKLDRGLAERRWARKVEQDIELAARLRAFGTPVSFVNGVMVSGSEELDRFRELVEQELTKANTLIASGVPRDMIYTRLASANYVIPEEPTEEPDSTKIVYRVPVGSGPIRGPKLAPVTIVVFSDFECPFCKRAEETLATIRQTYADKVRIVWRDLPLPRHLRAEPAAELARAARAQRGDEGFWTAHDLLFAAQPGFEDADLERIAKEAKLDVKKAMSSVRAKAYKQAIDDDGEVADDFEANGTPHFFINGRRLAGAKSFDTFKPIVDEEIKRADSLLMSGVAMTDLYEALTKDGVSPPEPERRAISPAAQPSPFAGAPNAKLVITEVADFQCSFCRRANATMEELLKAYPGKIKIVWRDDPLPRHPDAPLAAEAAREAFAQQGSLGFTKMQKLLFDNQGALERDKLDGYARSIGLDMARFTKALDSRSHKAAVDADIKAASDALVRGTPAFFVGPYFISGAQPYSKFKKLVERELGGGKTAALPRSRPSPSP